MNFIDATTAYETWLAGELEIVPADLDRKHALMKEALFPFFRATFYRWAQLWPELCPELDAAPRVLAVGDLHVENFGTWRDAEGRLVWGINDFDETARMPYTIDLVRLAASAHLAIEADHLKITGVDACKQILAGYKAGLEAGGRPWVLEANHAWLRTIAGAGLREPVAYWEKLRHLPPLKSKIPGAVKRALGEMMPEGVREVAITHRVAGVGSLGRQRFVAVGEYAGGPVCREAKALAPSAWFLMRTGKPEAEIRYQKALDTAARAPDPFVRLSGSWIVRRLAPDCSKIDLAMFPKEREEKKLLHAMGWETANLHVGSGKTGKLIAHLSGLPRTWLHKAASGMLAAARNDWAEWKQSPRVSM